MGKFDFMKKYVKQDSNENVEKNDTTFYKLEKDSVESAEKRLDMKFPDELREFYLTIGYGFIGTEDYELFDRFMGPSSVADFYTLSGQFVYNPSIDFFIENNQFVFFEVCEDTFLSIDLNKKNEKGESPICFFGTEVAPSLEVFLKRMEDEKDYYLEYAEE
jgi:hypothetical protein